MPKIHGLLDDFPNLEAINSQSLAPILGRSLDQRLIDNLIGNWILYPQVVPEMTDEYKFQLAFLTQAVKVHAQNFYHPSLKRIYIPESLSSRVPNLEDLVWIFLNALVPTEINTIILRQNDHSLRVLGSYIRPHLLLRSAKLNFQVKDKKYELKPGNLLNLPDTSQKVDIKFSARGALLLGKEELVTEVSGGVVGVIVDAAIK